MRQSKRFLTSLQTGSRSLKNKLKEKDFRVMVLRRRQLVFVLMVALVLSAGYVNYRYQNAEEKQVYGVLSASESVRRIGETRLVSAEQTDYFSEARLAKTKARDERLELIEEVLENGSDEEKKQAQQQKLELGQNIERETVLETVLNAKGFENILVTITDQGVTVSVQTEDGIKSADSAKITEAVVLELGTSPENIKIIEVQQ